MPQATQSIFIQGDPHQIFALTNDIERWPALFHEYSSARVLSTEHSGFFTLLKFELSNAQGETWRSWRLLNHKDLNAIAQRSDPMFPFAYMHLAWNYEPVGEGVQMTWTQDFEMDPKAPVTNEGALARMLAHMAENQSNFKRILESPEGHALLAATETRRVEAL